MSTKLVYHGVRLVTSRAKAHKWTRPTGSTLALLEAAHAHAVKYEPTSRFPGVDIDAAHKRAR